jgi:hypothetical protein
MVTRAVDHSLSSFKILKIDQVPQLNFNHQVEGVKVGLGQKKIFHTFKNKFGQSYHKWNRPTGQARTRA